MPSSEERMMILRMVEEGKLTPEDGARLLTALGEQEAGAQETKTQNETWNAAYAPDPATGSGRNFRVRVSNLATGRQKVTVNIPLGLVDFGLRFVPQNSKFDVNAVRNALHNGMTGKIVDVTDDEKGDRVEVFVE
jgi:hypothetical protein